MRKIYINISLCYMFVVLLLCNGCGGYVGDEVVLDSGTGEKELSIAIEDAGIASRPPGVSYVCFS